MLVRVSNMRPASDCLGSECAGGLGGEGGGGGGGRLTLWPPFRRKLGAEKRAPLVAGKLIPR